MVHKKYTYKDGKRFGPYYYETKRVDGHVVTTYLGTSIPKKSNYVRNFIFVISFLLILSLAYFISSNITGNASLDIKTNYNFGESINGELELNLLQGELIPADSVVLVSYGNFSKEFVLSDLVSNELISGEFYADGLSLSGEGQGYGIPGKVVEYPVLDFEFSISQDNSNSESNGGSNNPEEFSEGTGEIVTESENSESSESQSESSGSETSSSESSESSESSSSAGITGAVISDSIIISGSVSKDNDFSYDLNERDSASLVSGSVYYEDVQIEDSEISFDVDNNKITVTTDYSIEKEGFGEDYISNKKEKVVIDLSSLGLIADNEGLFSVSLVYQDEVIVEVSEDISISRNLDIDEPVDSVPEVIVSENESVLNQNNITNATIPENVTISNQTLINETVLNVTQVNQTLINETLVEVTTTQFTAVIGQPVRWVKTISLDINDSLNLTVEIPASAENVTVSKINSGLAQANAVSNENSQTDLIVGISGEVTADIDFDSSRDRSFFTKIFEFFRFTGRVVTDLENEVQEVSIEIEETDSGVEVEYYTDAPVAVENVLNDKFKTILVSSPADVHYENVVVYTNISDSLGLRDSSLIKIEWVENSSFLDIYSINDSNNDGNYDYIQWIAPHLSNQTFNIIIIIDAIHLDSNRNFISNIYNETKELDNVWSESIPSGDYVRVTFEQNLTNENDITIYPRASEGNNISNVLIEVYEKDSNLSIAQFSNLNENEYNKIFLTNLTESQDTFDLKILNGNVEFDHIIDPTIALTGPVGDIGLTPLDTNKFAIIYVNDTANSVQVLIKNTNGTLLVGPITVANGTGLGYNNTNLNVTRVAIAAVNSTSFVVGWTNRTGEWRAGLTTSGGYYFSPTTTDGSIGATLHDIALTAYNSTLIAYCYADGAEGDFDMIRFSAINGAIVGSELDINAAMTPETSLNNIMDCSAVNATTVAAFEYHATNADDATYHLVDYAGTEVLTDTDIDTAVGTGAQVATAALDNNKYVLAWYDQADQDITISINRTFATSLLAVTDIDTAAGTASRLAIATVKNTSTNTDNFVVVYYNQTGTDIVARFYNGSGTALRPPLVVESNPSTTPMLMSATGINPATGIGLCNETWMVSYTNSTNRSVIKTYWLNGTEWDGECVTPADTTPPMVTINQPQNATVTSPVIFNITTNEDSSFANYTLNNGVLNYTMQNNGNRDFNATNATIANGQYTVRYFVWDGTGNLNSTVNRTFIVEQATEVSSCRVLSSSNTVYNQTANIIPTNASVPCINITASNVTFDGNGYSIYNSTFGNNGIWANGRLNITVRGVNITLSNIFSLGISFNSVNNSFIRNSTFNLNAEGIDLLSQSSGNIIANITANNNGQYGLYIEAGSNNTFSSVTANNNLASGWILVQSSNNNSFSSVTANNNSLVGIRFVASNNNSFSSVTANNNLDGIRIEGSNNNKVSSLTANNNSENSIHIYFSEFNFFKDSFIYGSGQDAIFFEYDNYDIGTSNNNRFENVTVLNTNSSRYDLFINAGSNDINYKVNNTYIIDSYFANYSIPYNGTNFIINNSRFGEVRFLKEVIGNGTNLTRDVRILNNSATVRSDLNPGLNKSANVTLYGLSTSFGSPVILRDGVLCSAPSCNNFTSLNAGTVVFNVTSWTNYSIGDIVAPIVTINNPQNATLNPPIIFNITTNEDSSFANYTLTNGLTNYTMQNNGNRDFNATNTSIADGQYTVKYFVWDVLGNLNSTATRTFLSYGLPNVTFVAPTPATNTVQSETSIFTNVTSYGGSYHTSFVDMNRDLLLWMRFDNLNSSNDPLDSSTYSINGSKFGNTVQNTSGRFGKSFTFDGSGDFVTVPSQIYSLNEGTVSLWFNKPQDALAGNGIITGSYGGTGDQRSPTFFLDTEGILRWEFGSLFNRIVSTSLNNNTWYHAVMTYNSSYFVSVYFDGILVDSAVSTAPGDFLNAFHIATYDGSGSIFNGSIDDLIVFNRSFTQSEVRGLYNTSSLNTYSRNFTNLAVGSYVFNASVQDSNGNLNASILRVNISNDVAPIVTIILPGNTTYNSLPIRFNISTNENSTANYTLTNGLLNYTMTSNASGTGFNATNASIADGQYTVRYFARDISGNLNSTTNVTFAIDTTAPLVTINQPQNATLLSPILFNVTTNENTSFANYSLNNGLFNYTMQNNGNLDFNATNVSIASGQYTVRYFVWDQFGNFNSTVNRTFTVDITPPQVTIILPQNTTYFTLPIRFNVSTNENTSFVNYTLNNGLVNYTMTANATGRGFNATNASIWDGQYTVRFFAWDILGNLNSTRNVTFATESYAVQKLKAQTCSAMFDGVTGVYDRTCDGTYPSTTCPGDLVTCDDGSFEDQGAKTGFTAGINISVFNNTITNCLLVQKVILCYEWWNNEVDTLTVCPIYVDSNGGVSESDIGASCPLSSADPGRTCVDVTSLEGWTCENFFGTSGTRALARTEVLNDVASDGFVLTQDLLSFNVSYIEGFAPYNGTAVIINSTLGLNRTLEDLNVRTTLLDQDNNTMNVTVRWFNQSRLHTSQMYNLSYANGSTFIASLGHLNTTKGHNWSAQITINDGFVNVHKNSSTLQILDSPPNATLISPANNSISPNYTTQLFTFAMGDVDVPEFVVAKNLNFSSLAAYSGCDDINFNGSTSYPILVADENYSFVNSEGKFECPSYLWSVQPFSLNLGDYAPYFRINFTGVEPNVTLNAPANASTIASGTAISFNWTSVDYNITRPVVLCNLTIDGVINKTNINATNATMVNVTVTGFSGGDHTWNVSCLDGFANRGNSTTRTFTISSNQAPYNGTALIINSTLGLNRTLEDLNVRTTLLDQDNNTMNVTVRWFNNSILHLVQMYNSSYANGSTFIATLDDRNTTKGENWTANLTIHDGTDIFSVKSGNLTILNSQPNTTLNYPSNGSITLNRTNQAFRWVVSDDDGDGVVTADYDSKINISLVAGSTCTDSHYNGATVYTMVAGETSLFDIGFPLNCLIDNGDYYKWSVASSEDSGATYGPYAAPFNLSLQAFLSNSMNISSIDFGNLGYLKNNDTTDNSPKPLIIVNNGNVLNNIAVVATKLWNSVLISSIYYTFKFDNVTTNGISENGTFLWSGSTTTYSQMEIEGGEPLVALIDLNYTDTRDSAEMDINITVPNTEGPGAKNSVITFTISLGTGDDY